MARPITASMLSRSSRALARSASTLRTTRVQADIHNACRAGETR
ncbi:hypothetical protein AB0O57_27855 [Streptomyces sp. NPDC091201]